MSRVIERRGDQVYIEREDWDGKTYCEWEYDPVRMCACGSKYVNECTIKQETTFTETYACGYVYRYNNANGYSDNLISVNGKRIK